MNNRRWNRIDELSPQQEVELTSLVNSTPGMTRYGHRARTAVMLPLDIAREVADYADFSKISVSQAIIELLKRHIHSGDLHSGDLHSGDLHNGDLHNDHSS